MCLKFKGETLKGGKTFKVTSARFWNYIPVEVRE